MIAVQEMCGRVALVTSKGLSAIIKEHYPKWLLYSVLMLLVGANTINVYADINIMAASMKMLFGLPFALWATVLTLGMVVAQITVPYTLVMGATVIDVFAFMDFSHYGTAAMAAGQHPLEQEVVLLATRRAARPLIRF